MYLNKISVVDFKNIPQAALTFDSAVNCFVGDNGAGKTNMMEALHYLSMGKSSISMTDGQCIRHGSDFFMLDAEYRNDAGRTEKVLCSFKKGSGKTIKRNGKDYTKISEHIGLIPLVIISPSDSFLITDPAEERRRFVNAFLSQLDRTYLETLIRYNKVLGERNKLLKQLTGGGSDRDVLDILDVQLAENGRLIHSARAALIDRMAPIVEQYYSALSGDREAVEIKYRSELNDNSLEDLLKASFQKDCAMQFTSCGVHRDEIKMSIGGYALRKFGSQGQQKSFLIALKLAQNKIVAEERSEKPLLLLDDIFDKLDADRLARLLKLVSQPDFGQIFITDCSGRRMKKILTEGGLDHALFRVTEGKIEKL